MPYATGLATSLIVFAVGAILDFAVRVQSTAVNWNTVGVVLMVVGAVGMVLSIIVAAVYNSGRTFRRQRRVSRDANGTFIEERGTY